jgi:nitrite reductase/ring-hydroxylating ferredoxin subunit
MAEFVKVATLSELEPGACKAVEVGARTLAVCNVDGKIFAMDNECLHHGGPLGEGSLMGHVLTCPWHMWEYDVRTGAVLGNAGAKVNTYPVEIEGDDIKVAL